MHSITVVAFMVALGVLIVVHELGHYLVARLCGVKVLRFSVGFGTPARVRRASARDQTEWVVAAIPLGGYVKMLDEREGDGGARRSAHRAFNRQTCGARFAIVLAGPVANFLLAILVYAALFMHGVPEARPVLAEPPPGTWPRRPGCTRGDTVRAVDGEPVTTWQELRWRAAAGRAAARVADASRCRPSAATLAERDARPARLSDGRRRDATSSSASGCAFTARRSSRSSARCVAGNAGRARRPRGGRPHRARRRQADRRPGTSLVDEIRAHPGKPLALLRRARRRHQRGGSRRPTAWPSGDTRIGRIGAAPFIPPAHAEKMLITVRLRPRRQPRARRLAKTWDISVLQPEDARQDAGGRGVVEAPLRARSPSPTSPASRRRSGWISYLTFLALISISLGVLNLLPIPLLDGGHLMYYAIEIVKGSPVSERAMELGQRVGLALLLVMMAFAFYNDLNRLPDRLNDPQRHRRGPRRACARLAAASARAVASQPFTVKDIRVEGLQRTEPGTVFSYLPVKVGETMNEEKAQRRAARALCHRLLFQDVRLEVENDVLVVFVAGAPGDRADRLLRHEGIRARRRCARCCATSAWPKGASSTARCSRPPSRRSSASTCRAACTAREVQTTVTPLERNRVGINIAVTEGEVAKIRGINIVGAQAFKRERAARACSCCARPAGSPGTPSTTGTRARSSPPTSRRCARST